MKHLTFALLSLLASCSALPAAPAPQGGGSGQCLALYLGQRNLDENDYDPVDQQAAAALEFAQGPEGMLGFELGLAKSRDEETFMGADVKARTSEVYGGIRRVFGFDTVRTVLGGGVAAINSEFKVSGFGEDDDTSFGLYAHGGVQVLLNPKLFLGLDLRVLVGTDMTIAGVDTDADYGQIAVVLGVNL